MPIFPSGGVRPEPLHERRHAPAQALGGGKAPASSVNLVCGVPATARIGTTYSADQIDDWGFGHRVPIHGRLSSMVVTCAADRGETP